MGNIVRAARGQCLFTLLENIKQCELSENARATANLMKSSGRHINRLRTIDDEARKNYLNYYDQKPKVPVKGENESDAEFKQKMEDYNNKLQNYNNELNKLKLIYETKQDEEEEEITKVKEIYDYQQQELEQEKIRLEQELKILKGLKDAHKQLFDSAAADAKPEFGGGR